MQHFSSVMEKKKIKYVWNPVQITSTGIQIFNQVLMDKLIHGIRKKKKREWQMKIINK